MLNILQRSMPRKARNALRRRQDLAALNHLPRAYCDASKLRSDPPSLDARATPLIHVQVDRTGAVNSGDQRAIYALTRALQPKAVLEIGTHVGGSTLMFAQALPEGGKLTTVDILDVNGPRGAFHRYGLPSPAEQLARAQLRDRVQFVAQDSVRFLKFDLGQYDLIFLDGLHDARQVYQEVPAALERLTPGGLILMHDVFPHLRPLWPDRNVIPGPWLAIERLRSEGVPVRLEPLGDLPWPTKQGTRMTSLAYLLRA